MNENLETFSVILNDWSEKSAIDLHAVYFNSQMIHYWVCSSIGLKSSDFVKKKIMCIIKKKTH